MKLSKIIAQEENGKIQLYKHGVFWTAYEQSAYCIWKEKGDKVSCKFVKYMKRNIVSLGFPDSALKIWQDRHKTTIYPTVLESYLHEIVE